MKSKLYTTLLLAGTLSLTVQPAIATTSNHSKFVQYADDDDDDDDKPISIEERNEKIKEGTATDPVDLTEYMAGITGWNMTGNWTVGTEDRECIADRSLLSSGEYMQCSAKRGKYIDNAIVSYKMTDLPKGYYFISAYAEASDANAEANAKTEPSKVEGVKFFATKNADGNVNGYDVVKNVSTCSTYPEKMIALVELTEDGQELSIGLTATESNAKLIALGSVEIKYVGTDGAAARWLTMDSYVNHLGEMDEYYTYTNTINLHYYNAITEQEKKFEDVIEDMTGSDDKTEADYANIFTDEFYKVFATASDSILHESAVNYLLYKKAKNEILDKTSKYTKLYNQIEQKSSDKTTNELAYTSLYANDIKAIVTDNKTEQTNNVLLTNLSQLETLFTVIASVNATSYTERNAAIVTGTADKPYDLTEYIVGDQLNPTNCAFDAEDELPEGWFKVGNWNKESDLLTCPVDGTSFNQYIATTADEGSTINDKLTYGFFLRQLPKGFYLVSAYAEASNATEESKNFEFKTEGVGIAVATTTINEEGKDNGDLNAAQDIDVATHAAQPRIYHLLTEVKVDGGSLGATIMTNDDCCNADFVMLGDVKVRYVVTDAAKARSYTANEVVSSDAYSVKSNKECNSFYEELIASAIKDCEGVTDWSSEDTFDAQKASLEKATNAGLENLWIESKFMNLATNTEFMNLMNKLTKTDESQLTDDEKALKETMINGSMDKMQNSEIIEAYNNIIALFNRITCIGSATTNNDSSNQPRYAIDGRRVSNTYKGLVIQGGKKFLVK